ncbi:hypothetical protein BCR33DRAFT_740932 [Rhizoclosmatium globosum]|uniref:Uncharacterized protein n=1 Tax=Rhizoclosmatium globosum TaxID=329046 RepID=A0A1Y2BXY7_9FUNG|nr:hypothetical protein BCR33DRAFT_740932 [Rhizoclosmatium globosum]|eukprot:ORY39621.1 hypothetical protein BCR33DRAFT_740932 [Rhizoclosmatium globosum]
MPFHISTAGASLNNATYTSHKRTVHIPGSHALPPGVSTTMAWELGYARKRFEADTRGIENTVNPDVYRLQEGRFVVREDAKVKHDEALLMAEELRDSVRTVERGERVRFEDMGAVSGDVKGLDHLNPYFMHLEMLKKKYTPKELVTWSYSGRGVKDKRVPVGGWPSGVEFEMGVKYMPEISDTVFVMKPVGHTDDNGAAQDEQNEEGRQEDEEEEDKDKQEVRPLSAPLPGETKNEHLLREILNIQNDKSIAASEVLTASTKVTIPESSTTEKESRQSEHKEPQSQDPQRVFPQQYPQPNYFPLPAVPSIPAINPAHLPLAYACEYQVSISSTN